jgi:RsmE family RNA methyltransferase
VNWLLLEPDELHGDRAELHGRRATHVREVLRAMPGQRIKVGIVDGPLGSAVIEALGDDLVLQVTLDEPPPPAGDVLLLAVPRPKVLLRMLAHAAALGFGRIVLLRTWRVDKSHLQSTAMRPETWRAQLLLGLEQAGRTALPRVEFFPLFRPFVEDRLAGLDLPRARFVAHPAAADDVAAVALAPGSAFALAIGPDGGLLPYEVEQFAARGFVPVQSGRHPLRTETALAVLAGQLDLLRRRATVTR